MEEIKNNIVDVITTCDTAQFCTFASDKLYPETRIVANMINKNNKNINIENLILHFMTNKNSNKIQQIKNNNNVCIYYFNQETRKAMTLFGSIEIIESMNEKSKFWNDSWKNFGYIGKYDENYCVIKFTPKFYKFFIKKEEKYGKL